MLKFVQILTLKGWVVGRHSAKNFVKYPRFIIFLWSIHYQFPITPIPFSNTKVLTDISKSMAISQQQVNL